MSAATEATSLESVFISRPCNTNGLWELTNKRPCSLSGVELNGNKLVKLFYLDESGISKHEAVLVVAGVAINADDQWMEVEQYIDQLISQHVPQENRDGFSFHATDLFHGSGEVFDRNKYPLDQSHRILKKILEIPSRFRLPVVFGYLRKRQVPPSATKRFRRAENSKNHAMVYALCALAAERFMKDRTPFGEITMLVAENNTETQRFVKEMHGVLKGQNAHAMSMHGMFESLSDQYVGLLPITKIKDTVHFVEKKDAVLLQIADACALIIRYAIEEKQGGQPFVNALSVSNPGVFKVDPDTGGFMVLDFVDKPVA